MIRYLILALPRTGSSMLQRIFMQLRGLPFIREPFNRDEWPGLHPPSIHGVTNLMERLRILAAPGTVHGVKHVHDPLHWELGTPMGWQLLGSLCRMPDCAIVFLYRTNVLRQFLSMEIARQTGNWSVTTEASVPARAGAVRQTGNMPWTDPQIEAALEILRQTNERIAGELARAGAHHLSFSYETLFGGGTSEFDRIAEHFGVATFRGDAQLETALAQGERQAALSSLYERSDDLRRLDDRFGALYGRAYDR